MTKQYHKVVFLLRGQPLHNAHKEILRRAQSLSHNVVVIIGSSYQPRTFKNPFTYAERHVMVRAIVEEIDDGQTVFHIRPNVDSVYNDPAWAARVQQIVSEVGHGTNIAIIGHKKDTKTSSYLDMFPQWKIEEVESIEPLNATDVRELFFRRKPNLKFLENVVPKSTLGFLETFYYTDGFLEVLAEREFADEYKKQYAGLKYEPVHVTVDAVLYQAGHVLMVKRRDLPGKGLWALPGGFFNAGSDVSVQSAMIRELREETGIKVPEPVLIGNIRNVRVFDAIDRSSRGRVITHAFHIVLPDGPLPRVKGMDDAEKAEWVQLIDLKRTKCFEDHFEIIQTFTGVN